MVANFSVLTDSIVVLMPHLIHLTTCLVLFGLLGLFVFQRSLILMLVALEIILLAVSSNFIIFSLYLDDIQGQLFSLFVLTIAGVESSIGLALLVVYHRITGVISAFELTKLKG
jgi:NADH-quinone oxidoreductase subunit K